MLSGLLLLLVFLVTGEFLNQYFDIPIPGSILGMLLMLAALLVIQHTPKNVKEITDRLTPLLPLFIIPVSAGLITQKPLLQEHGLILLGILTVSLIPGIIITAWIIQIGKPSTPEKENK